MTYTREIGKGLQGGKGMGEKKDKIGASNNHYNVNSTSITRKSTCCLVCTHLNE